MHVRHAMPERESGFTLIEVLTVIAIVAVLAAMAVPSFNQTLASSRIWSATSDLSATFDLARMESLRRDVPVVVCRTDNPNAAAVSCSAGAVGVVAGDDWSSGWIVFAKGSSNVSLTSFESGDVVLQRMATSVVQAARRLSIQPSPSITSVAVQRYGRLNTATDVVYTVDYLGDTRPNPAARCFRISGLGRGAVGRVVANQCN